MKIPEYITIDEVKRVCRELKLSDWTEMKESAVPIEEALILLPVVNTVGIKVETEEFRRGLEVELEHGTTFPDFNVTNNHPILTAKVVMAHFMETPDYYRLLDVAELEGDLLKALAAGNIEKAKAKHKKLSLAKVELGKSEAGRL
jgi:molybdopterin/thiamine biosynthesis adenylyltransferase